LTIYNKVVVSPVGCNENYHCPFHELKLFKVKPTLPLNLTAILTLTLTLLTVASVLTLTVTGCQHVTCGG